MIVYDLAVLFMTALPAIAHDSLLFKNLEKGVEDGIMKIYMQALISRYLLHMISRATVDRKHRRY